MTYFISEFESLGDCYWVVQLEFLRHSAIEKIRYGSMLHESTTITLQSQGFSSNGTFHADDVYNRLNEVFSIDGKEVFPVNSRCVVLAQNTVSLKQEIDVLILVIDQNANPRVNIYMFPVGVWRYHLVFVMISENI
jgi:hypothetical protein